MDSPPSTGASPDAGAPGRLARLLSRWRADGARLSSWLFLRLLGACLATAGWSLASQVHGLLGAQGIWPAASVMDWARDNQVSLWHFPTLTWLSAGDGFLAGLCWICFAAGIAVMLGVLPWFSLLTGLLAYGSLMRVGGPFLSFQWDALLVETLFLALFLQPVAAARPAGWRAVKPRTLGLLLLQFLGFKLMLSSGIVKLASGDPAWRDGTALTYHFWTQPLPVWTAWYAHHLPLWALKALQGGMFFVELILPALLFIPGIPRAIAGLGFLLLMGGIAATGNYTFFNLLAAALALLWIDDRVWARLFGRRFPGLLAGADEPAPPPRSRPRRAIAILLGVLLLPVPLGQTLATARLAEWRLPPPWRQTQELLQSSGLANGYGLFAVMTTRRPEIRMEVSPDGRIWAPIAFRHKPGDLKVAPGFVAPHQPRLDWQMWFAALADQSPEPWRQNPWLVNLMQRVLERSPAVLGLFADVPGGRPPPRYIRCVLHYYRFATPAEHAADGSWWAIAGGPRLFVPPISLQESPP